MPGGLIQLISKGIEDNYLIGNPKLHFFIKIYKKYTNFAQITIKKTIENNHFDSVEEILLDIEGDLISDISLSTNINGTLLKNVSIYNIIKKISLIFSNTTINELTPHSIDLYNNIIYNQNQLHIINNLTKNILYTYDTLNINIDINNNITTDNNNLIDNKKNKFFIIYNYANLYKFTTNINYTIHFYTDKLYTNEIQHLKNNNITYLLNKQLKLKLLYYTINFNNNIINSGIIHIYQDFNKNTKKFYLNLPFWFTNKSQLSIPIFLMLYEKIKIRIEFSNYNNLILNSSNELYSNNFTKPILNNTELIINYILLENEHRKYIANKINNYLIEKIKIVEIPINTSILGDIKNNIKLDINNIIKSLFWYSKDTTFIKSIIKYKNTTISFDNNYFTNFKNYENNLFSLNKYYYNYNFSLDLINYQPTGHLNIINSHLYLELNPIYKPNIIYINNILNNLNLFGENINITNNEINLYKNINYYFSILININIFITDYIITNKNIQPVYYKYYDYLNNILYLENEKTNNKLVLYLYDTNFNYNYLKINILPSENVITSKKKLNIFMITYNILSFKDGLSNFILQT